MALHESLARAARDYPHKTALLFEDDRWSYGEIDAVTDRMAAGLVSLGIRPGDRVALLFGNCPQAVFAYYACFKAGVVAVPINPRMKGPEMAYVVNHSGAKALIGQASLYRELAPLQSELTSLESCFLTGDTDGLIDVREFSNLQELASDDIDLPGSEEEALAAILYTSGTTARPKGVIHTHTSLGQLVGMWSPTAFKVFASVAPIAHIGSLCHMLTTFHCGGTLLLFPAFEPSSLLRGIERHNVTAFWLLPVMYGVLAEVENPSAYDLSSVEFSFTAGDSLPEDVRTRVQQTFGLEVVEVCGMTELIYSTNVAGEDNRPGSIGKPLPRVEMRLVDEYGKDVPQGEVGEILARGPNMMSGYWQEPQATAEALRDGWMHTGDLARQDEEGYYWFVGRNKDIIIRGGSNIAPAEVEEALHTHPEVSAAGVVGVPHPSWGQVIWAFVTLKDNAQADETALRNHLQTRIAPYKVPETIRIVPSLPIGLTGKIHRKTLREWAAESR